MCMTRQYSFKYSIKDRQSMSNYGSLIAKQGMRKYHVFHKLNGYLLRQFNKPRSL